MHHIRADPATRTRDQLLDLVHELVDRTSLMLPFLRADALVPQLHIPGHGVVITPRQLGRRTVTTREVVSLQDFHDLPAALHPADPSRPASAHDQRGGIWPSAGRTVAVNGALFGRQWGVFRGRGQPSACTPSGNTHAGARRVHKRSARGSEHGPRLDPDVIAGSGRLASYFSLSTGPAGALPRNRRRRQARAVGLQRALSGRDQYLPEE